MLTDVGTEELGHIEMISAILYQLTRNLSISQIKKEGFDAYFVDHTTGIYPQGASGVPFSACTLQVTGDTIADLSEDLAAEQKARLSYDNILRMIDDPEVRDPIKFLREREIVHFQRFGEALRITQENLDSRNFYAFNPSFDRKCNPPDIAPVAPAPLNAVAGTANMSNVSNVSNVQGNESNTQVSGVSKKADEVITGYKNLDTPVSNVSNVSNVESKTAGVSSSKVSDTAVTKPTENMTAKVSDTSKTKTEGVESKVSDTSKTKTESAAESKVSDTSKWKTENMTSKVSDTAKTKTKGVESKVSDTTKTKTESAAESKVSDVGSKVSDTSKTQSVSKKSEPATPKPIDWTYSFNQPMFHGGNYGYNPMNPYGYNPSAKRNKRNNYGHG